MTSINIDINDFFYETSQANTKSEGFDFAQTWGELNSDILAINDSSAPVEQTPLAEYVGDITPATTAVAYGDSPFMNTPFLDSCQGTPYTPAIVPTPSLAQYDSDYRSPFINNSTSLDFSDGDVFVSQYLQEKEKEIASWQGMTNEELINTPALCELPADDLFGTIGGFNGDPNQLFLPSTSGEASNDLFPPVPSHQLTTTYEQNPTYDLNQDLFNTEFGILDYIDNNLGGDLPLPAAPQDPVIDEIPNKKRKNKEDLSGKKNKRVKIADEKPFKCGFCDAAFNRRFNLGTHIKIHDKNRSKDFSCKFCPKTFDRRHDLSRHIATVHNGERAHKCDACTLTFSRKDALIRHQLKKHQA